MGHRDFGDFKDVFQCLDASTGESIWQLEYLAIGKLDYGQSSRATPCIVDDLAILAGALGDLHCVRLADGEVIWKTNLKTQFDVQADMPWGFCGSPLIVNDLVIVQAGSDQASLVAFQITDGSLVWKSPGSAPSYGSLIVAELGGKQQIVGHDVDSLGGWDPQTGERLWTLKPEYEGDFNVPTPVAIDGKLLVVTENNGARLYRFSDNGKIDPEPAMKNSRLRPDMSSPVVVGKRVYCVDKMFVCLDLSDGLQEVYRHRDPSIGDYGTIVADDHHLLVTANGSLLLLDAQADQFTLVSRFDFSTKRNEIFSHPAIVGDRIYLRDTTTLHCWSLKP